MNNEEKAKLLKLESEAESLFDFIQLNKDLFSKNTLQVPLVPTDVYLLSKYLINNKYGYEYPNQPDFSDTLGAYEQFISSIPDDKNKVSENHGVTYLDKDALQGVTPQYVLDNFKKALAGREFMFPEILKYADDSMNDRNMLSQIYLPEELGPSTAYSATIEDRFISKADSIGFDLREIKSAVVMNQEHSDIDIQIGEFEDVRFRSTTVEMTDKTKALFESAGLRLIEIIEKNDVEGKNPWLDPVFTLNAYNPKTKYQYGLENKTILNDAVSTGGWQTAMFLSYDDVKKNPSLKIKSDELKNGTGIIKRFGKKVAPVNRTLPDGSKEPLLDDNGEQQWIYRRAATIVQVYNLDQLEFTGIGVNPIEAWKAEYDRPKKLIASNEPELEIFKEALIAAYPVPIVRGGHIAFYSPSRDEVSMPDSALYVNQLQELATMVHEGNHAAGHKSRLRRESLYNYHVNDANRGFEEILVNVAAVKLIQHYGLDVSELQTSFHKNEMAYNVGWARHVYSKDPTKIIEAMGEADRTFNYMKERIDAQLQMKNQLQIFIKDEPTRNNTLNQDKEAPSKNKSTYKQKVKI
ncbi:hypothetical protein E6W26_29120 [Pseudomonas aeruginosa]|uniref:zincin-like metallopeptidase domain-containing protein n=1 Tax=Pseudomonas aeruginosa TaxID=287 RepID=UPI00109DF4FF|nr:zincin-like metallopeptidase domain-containing protein [Pseudomonas aeruginosa]EKV1241263.1 hypothetical protein [Pseudomonas aeruginosa]EKV8586172.1 hypothetical protein [Pseudomonas aeruginosa]ELN5407390.1 hypothetical protein [Pseudomonas aeruginosa]ELP1438581.1 hypothetical protein [Pseudomonas aeruginosa]THB16461.1 hypothetical protein E6W26_29120 [Pseudomonas aeruginosa]